MDVIEQDEPMPDRRTRRPTRAATARPAATIPSPAPASAPQPIYRPATEATPEPATTPDEHGALAIGLMGAVLVLLALLTIAIALSV
jgi:hypothetical protein